MQSATEIKCEILLRWGSFEKAAVELSDDEYTISSNLLSKVVNGHLSTRIVRARLAKRLGKSVEELFGAQQAQTA